MRLGAWAFIAVIQLCSLSALASDSWLGVEVNPLPLAWRSFDASAEINVLPGWTVGPFVQFLSASGLETQYVVTSTGEFTKVAVTDLSATILGARVSHYLDPDTIERGWLASFLIGYTRASLSDGTFTGSENFLTLGILAGYRIRILDAFSLTSGIGIQYFSVPSEASLSAPGDFHEHVTPPLAKFRPWAELAIGFQF